MKKQKLLKIIVLILIISIIAATGIILIKNKVQTKNLAPEISRSFAYDEVITGDENVTGDDGSEIGAIKFDAFFLQDRDGDGITEKIRGTCNEVGKEATLWMELKVSEVGYLKEGKITINSDNFYFNTSIVKDNEIAENYISSNTKEIILNSTPNNVGIQKLLSGSVRSGNYSSSSSRTAAIGNDTNKFSKENSITFSGIYVDQDGNEKSFSKDVPFIIDWYGTLNSEITPKAQTQDMQDMNSLLGQEGLELDFTITVTENQNQLIMAGSYIQGTIPELNGYKPLSVKIAGTNVQYTYDEQTGNFTAQREAVLNENGIVTSNGYSSSSSSTKYNKFDFTVIYPKEAYIEMGEDVANFELAVPVQAYNKGFNNPNTEDGFVNPYISNTYKGIVVTTWEKKGGEVYSPDFDIYVGSYMGSPYYDYVVSKEKPLNIYNGISLEEKNDTYIVQWETYTGTNGMTDGIILEETPGKTDNFLNTSGETISMDDLTANKGIYFSGATSTLGEDGWIKVYDAETDALIETFTQSNWNSYNSSNPYIYENKVKHIRIETSGTNSANYLYVYNVKELDDEYVTQNFTREEFNELVYIYSYLDGYMINHKENETDETTYWYKDSISENALYEAPTSIAEISIKEDTISTQITAEHQEITIKTITTGYNEQNWKNGTFLVKLPSDIILAEINNVTTNNEKVKVTAYDLYEENGSYFIKILTENTENATFSIIVDCDLTPDPRIPKKTETVELYAINEIASDYYYPKADAYDIDGDMNINENVNYRTCSLTLDPGSSLSTTQTATNYGEIDGVTIAPRVAKTDKQQRTADITVSATNNYSYNIQDIKIQGVVPFEGNRYILSENDLESTFTTYMSTGGIKPVTNGISDYSTIYYSVNERPTNDINEPTNNWVLAENVEDWSKIKTYIIVIDNSYVLRPGETIEFEYEISIPQGIDYNEVTYSEHAIYFALGTDEGLYYASTGSAKLGFMIAKQYDLEIIKYQEDTQKVLPGVTFALTEKGAETSTIKTTNQDGVIVMPGLYAERYYTLKEIRTTDDYVLNEEEINFYTYTEINEDGTESLYLLFVDQDGNPIEKARYSSIMDGNAIPPNAEVQQDYKIQFKIQDEVKAKLAISKVDMDTNLPMQNVKFTITGKGKDEEILTTDKEGKVNISGLYLGEIYVLNEVKATDYYIPQTPLQFKITNNNGNFELEYIDNGSTKNKEIIINDEIPTISLDLQNEKIPTYGFKITKYAKDEKEIDGTDKVLQRAQFKIYGEGIKEDGKIYTTDENGVLTIDGLYEYVEGKYITGEYTLVEIYSPEGYALNKTALKFRAFRENGTLKIEILEGGDLIRNIVDETSGESSQDLNISNPDSEYPIIEVGIENGQIFTLFKYTTDGITNAKIPVPGTKFKITDLKGNYVTGTDGNIVGELDETTNEYLVTTDENGLIKANLPEGLYKAIEVYTDDRYIFPEDETKRTYYFGIGTSQAATFDWANSLSGQGWDYINSVEGTQDGGVIAVGGFSEYTSDIVPGATNGIDLNKDGIVDKVSQGNRDGVIAAYDLEGDFAWSKTFGGEDEDDLNKIIQTSDGGYIAVGYTESRIVKYDGAEIAELSKSDTETNLANKDAIILKLDKSGNYEWGVRFGGTLDDEIDSVIETSENNFVITGNYFSTTFNFYETGAAGEIKDSFGNRGNIDGFIASYSNTGKYQWSQRISSLYNVKAVDVTEYIDGLAVAVNSIGQVYATTEATSRTYNGSTTYQSGLVIGYGLDGTYKWYKNYSVSSMNNSVTSVDTTLDGNVIAGVNYGVSGKQIEAQVRKLTINGDSVTDSVIYTLSGENDEYVSSIKQTSDGGILFGGWYYTPAGMTGEGIDEFTEVLGDYTSDGYIIKLDSEGKVIYSSRMYGEGYEGVTTVTETVNGNLISGGYFNKKLMHATNFILEEEEERDVVEIENLATLEGTGNSDSFIISEGASGAEVPEAQRLEVENKVKNLKITTEVKKHLEGSNEVAGGDIDGEVDIMIDGITYSKDGWRFVESVEYGKNSTKEIKITPDANYVISYVKINDVETNNYTLNADGTAVIPIFENVTEDIHIVVEFSNTISNVEINHFLWTEENGETTQKVAETEFLSGENGTEYTSLPKTDLEYIIISNKDYYGETEEEILSKTGYLTLEEALTELGYYNSSSGQTIEQALETFLNDTYIPTNYKGEYKSGEKQIVNYYYKEKTYTLTVHHYLAGTNKQVPLKDSTTGETVQDEITENLKKGEQYSTSQVSGDLIDYSIYELVEVPENTEGTIEQDTEVTYYYQIRTGDLYITKVAEENHDLTLSGTEFALYKLVNEDSTTKDELIDKDNVSSEWELVNTYISSETGLVKLEDLPIVSEYRLVETKASDGRMIPEGQWKIEFESNLEPDQVENSIITTNITAIGNPPALVNAENGGYLLPNREYFDFPVSGDYGTGIFNIIGIVVITIGLLLFITSKRVILKKKITEKIIKNKTKN